MKAKTCGLSDEEKLRRRLHYCGTCKTMGALYGQKTRFLLNHDTVFLAEMLTALGGEDYSSWQKSYYSYNCLSAPPDKMPLALEFAATANVVLTEFKIKDHIADERRKRWQWAQQFFSASFQKAARKLAEWQFPLQDVENILTQQSAHENEPQGDCSEEILNYLAHPTAQATATFFGEGAKIIRCGANSETMFNIGFSFGKLIYLLDAYEDYEKDIRAGKFNAFQVSLRRASDNGGGVRQWKTIENGTSENHPNFAGIRE